MLIQIEVTTKCNFDCFYCAGRDMQQKHMDMDMFTSILKKLPDNIKSAILQGEGEPFLNKHIWTMCQTLSGYGITPYTITNGGFSFTPSFLKKIRRHFPRIGISIDTINPTISEKIGRHNLHKILGSLKQLLTVYSPREIDVYTVVLSKYNAKEVHNYLRQFGNINHFVQRLQGKDDYIKRYPFPKKNNSCTFNCRYINDNLMRFYNIDGIEMPCCYIKDASHYYSIDSIREQLYKQKIPSCCSGCREIIKPSPLL